jgi:hypothetical protein
MLQMKYVLLIITLYIFSSCKQNEHPFAPGPINSDTLNTVVEKPSSPSKSQQGSTSSNSTTQVRQELKPYLDNFNHFKKNEQTSIPIFEKLANDGADRKIILNKSTVKEALEIARGYSKSYILLGSYTIIEITDFKDCNFSKTWDLCAPKGRSYTKKGSLHYEVDYINHLMGTPDKRTRVLYVFK